MGENFAVSFAGVSGGPRRGEVRKRFITVCWCLGNENRN